MSKKLDGFRKPTHTPGLYDQLIDQHNFIQLTELAQERLQAEIKEVDPAELPDRIGELMGSWVSKALTSVATEERASAAIDISQALIEILSQVEIEASAVISPLAEPVSRLLAVNKLSPTDKPIPIRQPLTPLRDTVLMTNARNQPAVGSEIEAEIESADRIDLVLAFIRWTGIRNLLPALQRHVEAGKSIRIITTTYTAALSSKHWKR